MKNSVIHTMKTIPFLILAYVRSINYPTKETKIVWQIHTIKAELISGPANEGEVIQSLQFMKQEKSIILQMEVILFKLSR